MEPQVVVHIPATGEQAEIVMALLVGLGYEGFWEAEDEVQAFIPQSQFEEDELHETLEPLQLSYSIEVQEPVNWNEEWERNFQPVDVEERVLVRAPFHQPQPQYEHEIIVMPKMAFGTGHHATTWQVMRLMLEHDWSGKQVFDFGTGTGILAVLAEQLGAAQVLAVDNDPQAVENAREVMELNGCTRITVNEGTIAASKGYTYDCILGNITRNILIEYMPRIRQALKENGLFIASGFHPQDLPLVQDAAANEGLQLLHHTTRNEWVAAQFQVPTT